VDIDFLFIFDYTLIVDDLKMPSILIKISHNEFNGKNPNSKKIIYEKQ